METKVGVLYKEIIDAIRLLPLEQQAKIYNAIFDYQFTGQINDDDAFVKSFILSHKTNFDNMKSRRQINSENGKLGGAKKGNQNARKKKSIDNYEEKQPKQPKTTENEQKQPNDNQKQPTNNLKQEARSKKQEVKNKNQEEIQKEAMEEKVAKPPRTKFVKPTKEEIKDFALQEQLRTDCINRFYNYYESNGWRVGKAGLPMKSWKASYRNWCDNSYDTPKNKGSGNEFVDMLRKEGGDINIFSQDVVDVKGEEQ